MVSSENRPSLDIKIAVGIFTLVLFYFSLITSAVADEYKCSVVWSSGAYSGSGDSIGDAIDDARENCHYDQEVTAHECGASPINVNCIDQDGNCVNHAKFLQHGIAGGGECN